MGGGLMRKWEQVPAQIKRERPLLISSIAQASLLYFPALHIEQLRLTPSCTVSSILRTNHDAWYNLL
jgi:hypothetical protein